MTQMENTQARVFVVEDEGLIAHSIATSLRRAGYQVAGIAGSGEEALEKVSDLRPQLILMDIHLSGRMNGIEVAERVKELYEIPVVYLTAHSDVETLNRAKITEPFAYLPKPVQQANLFTAIEIALFRHRVETELRQQRAWLNTVLASMEDGVIVSDALGMVQFLNAHAEQLTGWQSSEAAGQPIARVLPLVNPSLELSMNKQLLKAIMQNSPSALPRNVEARHVSGATFPIDCEIAPSLDDRGTAGAVITFRNASERLMEEQEVRHDHKILAVGRLAAGVAHDFNNLLTVILGTAEVTLANFPANPALTKSLNQIIQAGEMAADITRKLLTFSSKKSMEASVVNMNDVVRNLEDLSLHLLGPDISFSCSLAPNLGLVRADPTALTEVLMNLITNARDAMPDGGHLTIQTRNVDLESQGASISQVTRYVALIVEDTGKGMDAKTAEHLFEPFFTTKFAGKGTGLGLSIVDGIVRDLGGSVDVDSEPGLGSTFTIYLPRANGDAKAVPAPEKQLSVEADDRTLLVVDDDPAVLRVLVSSLEASGYQLLTAESGVQALEVAAAGKHAVDLLITDVMMPKMTGPELSKRLRMVSPAMKTIFVTGFSGDLLRDHDLDPDQVTLLRKPFRQNQLLEQVSLLLNKVQRIGNHP